MTTAASLPGGGFQLGLYWQPEGDWSFGASFKSTQWFERYTFNSVNPLTGKPVSPKLGIDFPMTVSAGAVTVGLAVDAQLRHSSRKSALDQDKIIVVIFHDKNKGHKRDLPTHNGPARKSLAILGIVAGSTIPNYERSRPQ